MVLGCFYPGIIYYIYIHTRTHTYTNELKRENITSKHSNVLRCRTQLIDGHLRHVILQVLAMILLSHHRFKIPSLCATSAYVSSAFLATHLHVACLAHRTKKLCCPAEEMIVGSGLSDKGMRDIVQKRYLCTLYSYFVCMQLLSVSFSNAANTEIVGA